MSFMHSFVFALLLTIRARTLGGPRAEMVEFLKECARLLQAYEDKGDLGFVPIVHLPPTAKLLAAVAHLPVIDREGKMILRALIWTHQGSPDCLVRHEMAHLTTGIPQRFCWEDVKRHPFGEGPVKWYGVSPRVTANVEQVTNMVAMLDLLAGGDRLGAAMLVAAQETYWARAEQVRALLNGRALLGELRKQRASGLPMKVSALLAIRGQLLTGTAVAQVMSLDFAQSYGITEAEFLEARRELNKLARQHGGFSLSPWMLQEDDEDEVDAFPGEGEEMIEGEEVDGSWM